MPRDEATLLDIVTAARLAIEFRGDLDKDAFLADLKTRDIPRLLQALKPFVPDERS